MRLKLKFITIYVTVEFYVYTNQERTGQTVAKMRKFAFN